MTVFVIRFVVAGAIVASLPLAAQQLGPRAAGIIMMLPVVSILGLFAVYQTTGASATAAVAVTSLRSVAGVCAFLLTVAALLSRPGVPFAAAAGVGFLAFLAVARLVTA